MISGGGVDSAPPATVRADSEAELPYHHGDSFDADRSVELTEGQRGDLLLAFIDRGGCSSGWTRSKRPPA